MSYEHVLDVLHPDHPVFSPDGTRIAFVAEEGFSRPREGVASRIWIAQADGSGARQATRGPRADTGPRWAPDGRTLAFLSDRDHVGRAAVHLLEDGSGEARPLGEVAGSVEDVRFSPDGTRLLVLAADPGSDRAGADSATRIDAEEADPRVSRAAEHWRRLYSIDVASGETLPAGPEGLNVWEFDWRGGAVAAIVSDDPSESGWYQARLVLIDLATGSVTTLHQPAMQLAYPTLSPDGERVACVEGFCSDRGILAGETTVVATTGGDAAVLAPQIDVSSLSWRDERTLWFAGLDGLAHACGTIGLDGTSNVVWRGDASIASGWMPAIVVAPDGSRLVAAHSAWDTAPELRALDPAAPATGWRALSSLNPSAPVIDAACERRTWTSDEFEIEGLVLTPSGARTEPLPLVVWVHGGPTAAYCFEYPHASQVALLEAGYALLLPNPRGSAGRGQAFARANLGDMGGGDLRDILAGVDALVGEGVADDDRVAIAGGSYGGFMAAWAIGQTDRFRASIPMAAVTNWLSFHHTTNIGRFDQLFLDADPYDPTGDYFARSPVAHVRRVSTPALVIHGELDLCVPLSQGQELYQALAAVGVETELVVYPREGHGWRERAHILDGIERMREWLDRHLAVREAVQGRAAHVADGLVGSGHTKLR